MGADAVGIPATSVAKPSLTSRASLTALASLLDYAVKIGVTLLVTPVLVGGLGRSLYGVWEMLNRLVHYMAAADGRPTEALRLLVANQQTTADAWRQRRHVGSAAVIWLLFLPLVVVVGAGVTWIAPTLTKVPPDLHGAVRLTCALLVASFLVAGLASIPESVLRGMNLGYRRMGLQASLNIATGVLMAGAVVSGLGLPGLAAAQIAVAALTGLCFWTLARKYVAWFGAERPQRAEVRQMVGMSGWLALGELITRLLLASDVIILGALISSSAVTSYVMTGYAAKMAIGILTLAVGAAMPGLAGVIGEGHHRRAAQVRREIAALTWLFVTVAGGTILVWNRSFVSLWVGPDNYAGLGIDALIVLIAVQTAFIRTDAYVIDAALRPRERVVVGAAAALASIGLSVALTHAWGLPGLCLGVLSGRAVQSVAFPLLVRRLLGSSDRNRSGRGLRADVVRPVIVTVLLFALAAFLGGRVLAPHWLAWAGGVAATVALLAVVTYWAGFQPDARNAVRMRVTRLVRVGAM